METHALRQSKWGPDIPLFNPFLDPLLDHLWITFKPVHSNYGIQEVPERVQIGYPNTPFWGVIPDLGGGTLSFSWVNWGKVVRNWSPQMSDFDPSRDHEIWPFLQLTQEKLAIFGPPKLVDFDHFWPDFGIWTPQNAIFPGGLIGTWDPILTPFGPHIWTIPGTPISLSPLISGFGVSKMCPELVHFGTPKR